MIVFSLVSVVHMNRVLLVLLLNLPMPILLNLVARIAEPRDRVYSHAMAQTLVA